MENWQTKKFRTTWESIFMIAVAVLIIAILVLVWWRVYTIVQQQRINSRNDQLEERQEELKTFESAVEYDRFIAVKDLEAKSIDMPWFEHIPKILSMFQDLKELDKDPTHTITLSDFFVSLEEISLRWTISSLRTLYYNTESFKALLDRFKELDFIKDIRIKSYEKVGSTNFEFILNANVVWNE